MNPSDDPPWLYYDDTAAGYDELHGDEQSRKVKTIIGLIRPSDNWKVLDVGCGTGVSMQGWSCEIVGVEPSQEMAAIARKKGFDVTVAPAERLPFPDNSFDLAIAVTSAHHFKPEAFMEMARIARRAVITLLKNSRKKTLNRIIKGISSYWDIDKKVECSPDVILVCHRL